MTTKKEEIQYLSKLAANIVKWGDDKLVKTTEKVLNRLHREAIDNHHRTRAESKPRGGYDE